MFEKMTDGDVMIYLRNTMLALSQLAQERQIRISANIEKEGYCVIHAEDYEVCRIEEAGNTEYAFMPIGEVAESRIKEWHYNILPQSIRFGQAPKEEKHGE